MATIKEAIEYSKVNPKSAFATELRKRIESGQMNTELESAGLQQYISAPTPQPKQGIVEKSISNIKQRGENILSNVDKDISTPERVLQNAGQVVAGAGDVLGNAVGAGLEATGLDKPLQAGAEYIANTAPVKEGMELYGQLPERVQDNVEGAANVIAVATGLKGAQVVGDIALQGAKATNQAVKSGVSAVADSSVVQGVGTVLKSTGASLKRVPDRIATNVAEKQASELAIASLPTKTAQTAVRDGIDIVDVKELSSIPRTPESNKLIKTVKDFANGDKKVDPIEVVGEQAINRFKEVVKQKKQIGSLLGEASKTIGILTKPELETGVLAKLKKVSGLENLSMKNGILDFAKTRLNTTLSKSDRTSIQEAFRESTKWGDGEKAHQFRQTLFETLGGKKKGKVVVTDTQEQAFEAIRGGLSDVIEIKSPTYKKLSNEYRKIVEPVRELQKKLKTLDPNVEDLSDSNLSAGILARRITSTAASNPEIRKLLKTLDSVGTTKGSSFEKTMQLQDMYNILNKYYDIAPKTGFQNLVKEGFGSSDSIVGMAKETVKNVVGKSNAVRQKALEDLLDELGVVLK